jgi:uncharacterized protein (DUF2062 family)
LLIITPKILSITKERFHLMQFIKVSDPFLKAFLVGSIRGGIVEILISLTKDEKPIAETILQEFNIPCWAWIL